MELELEILNGARQGTRFFLPVGGEVDTSSPVMPYVLETEALAFFVRADRACETLSLCIGERTLPFTQGRKNCSSEFELFPAYRENGGRNALLFNYFGVARFSLKLECDGAVEYLDTGPLEVLARRVTANQAVRMVNFILGETDSELSENIGTTRFQNASSGRGEQLNRVVEQLLDNIRTLEKITPHILARPLRAVTSDQALRNGSQVEVQSDQGMAWLMDNLSVLEETDDNSQSHLSVDDRSYYASEVLAPVVREHTDLYENRVLVGYLENLLSFTTQLLESYSPAQQSHRQNVHEGYVSFFACMKDWIHQVHSQQLAAVRECRDRLEELHRQFTQWLPVGKKEDSLPRITAKVRGNKDYLILFRMMIQWYQNSKMELDSQQLFLAIKSMPELFEYYSLLRVRRWLLKTGQSDSQNSAGHSPWQTRINRLELSLSYEPTFWMAGNSRAGQVVNTENRSVYEARNNWVGRPREYEYARRSPDITIEVKSNGELLGLLVMDAKYTTREQAFKHYLPECTMKYVHGIARADSPTGIDNVVKAMIILYADADDEFMDFHAAPYDAYGVCAQLPILGAQALSLKSPDQIGGRSLEVLLDRLLVFFTINDSGCVGGDVT